MIDVDRRRRRRRRRGCKREVEKERTVKVRVKGGWVECSDKKWTRDKRQETGDWRQETVKWGDGGDWAGQCGADDDGSVACVGCVGGQGSNDRGGATHWLSLGYQGTNGGDKLTPSCFHSSKLIIMIAARQAARINTMYAVPATEEGGTYV
jgi:hypothetical protein